MFYFVKLNSTMKRIIQVGLGIGILVTSIVPVFAQDATPTSTRRERGEERREERREQFATRTAERREAIQDRLAEHREQLASRAAELKARLAAFKDRRKAALVEKISNVLNKINEKRTNAMRRHLEKMSELLGKLVDRVANKGGQGKDTSQVDSAIASASAAIASASAAVDAQALKDYTITISSESAARVNAKVARDKLHTDLQAVRKLVVAAKQAVANAIRVAATTLGGIGEGSKEATEGGSQ